MNRALLVGINKYPSPNELHGCVNDVNDMASFLVAHCGFKAGDIRLLVDERATANGIRERIGWLLTGVAKGDRILFHYSGHGAQVATRNPQGEADHLDEVICPVDFSFDNDSSMIRDKDFVRMFGSVPDGVEFVWVSDSCFSGGLSRGFQAMPRNVNSFRSKRFAIPADIEWRVRTVSEKRIKALSMKGAAKQLNAALVSGCTESQESADADINGRFNGALTFYLLDALGRQGGLRLKLSDVVKRVVAALRKNRFDQRPELLGSKTIAAKPFLQ